MDVNIHLWMQTSFWFPEKIYQVVGSNQECNKESASKREASQKGQERMLVEGVRTAGLKPVELDIGVMRVTFEVVHTVSADQEVQWEWYGAGLDEGMCSVSSKVESVSCYIYLQRTLQYGLLGECCEL